jgi:hypothetical protein
VRRSDLYFPPRAERFSLPKFFVLPGFSILLLDFSWFSLGLWTCVWIPSYRGKDAPSSASIRSPAPAAFAARQGAFFVWFAARTPTPVLDFSVRPLNFSSPRLDLFDVEFVFPSLLIPALLCRMRTVFPLVGAAPLEFSAPTPRLPYLRSFLLSGVGRRKCFSFQCPTVGGS